jgi:FlaG/FlaF family flagellin (archaellin)
MVAITVILAAVIAAFVFGMTGTVNKTKIVAITMNQVTSDKVTIMNSGGQDAKDLTEIRVSGDLLDDPPEDLGITVGSSGTYEMSEGIGQKHIIAVGVFKDSTESVLLDTWATRTVE